MIKLPVEDQPLDVVVLSNAFAVLSTLGTITIVHEHGYVLCQCE